MAEEASFYRAQDVLNALTNARKQLADADAASHEPIAIVGIGCKLPGGIDSPAAFGRLLFDGRDALERIPSDRWDAEAWYHPEPEHPGTSVSRHGAFVRDIDQFDAEFFGISEREANYMDPQ